jgi:hypothetical protein
LVMRSCVLTFSTRFSRRVRRPGTETIHNRREASRSGWKIPRHQPMSGRRRISVRMLRLKVAMLQYQSNALANPKRSNKKPSLSCFEGTIRLPAPCPARGVGIAERRQRAFARVFQFHIGAGTGFAFYFLFTPTSTTWRCGSAAKARQAGFWPRWWPTLGLYACRASERRLQRGTSATTCPPNALGCGWKDARIDSRVGCTAIQRNVQRLR